tara:strand:+ start:139 stop:345 length:207 start_codon:yes stop_codon:yes gene_type:complete
MARGRKKRWRKRDNGILHEGKLMFTSKARRSGMIFGMVLAPIVMAYTKFGGQAGKWIVEQTGKLGGKQ